LVRRRKEKRNTPQLREPNFAGVKAGRGAGIDSQYGDEIPTEKRKTAEDWFPEEANVTQEIHQPHPNL